MSKQEFVAGVEPVRVWAWIEAPDAGTVAAKAAPAIHSSDDVAVAVRRTRRYVVGAANPVEDPIEPWRRMQERLEPLLGVPYEQANFPAQVEALALDILQMVEADPDMAILAMVRLDPFDYAVAHALQTAVACAVYGHAVGTPPEQRIVLIQAAMTMNIAMLELQRELEWQSTPPSSEQRKQIHEHPRRGRRMLEALGVTDQTWLRAVAEHHELPDGTGYPTGSQGASSEAEILSVVDRYCAMLSRRGLRDSMASNRAAQSLCNSAHSQRQSLASRIIEVFGQHPPGSLVRLVNGEIAIVVRRSHSTHPEQVCALASADGEPLAESLLRDTSDPFHVIVGSVADRDFKGVIDYVGLQRMMA